MIDHMLSKSHRAKRSNDMDMIMANDTIIVNVAELDIESTYKVCI